MLAFIVPKLVLILVSEYIVLTSSCIQICFYLMVHYFGTDNYCAANEWLFQDLLFHANSDAGINQETLRETAVVKKQIRFRAGFDNPLETGSHFFSC